MRRTFRTLLLLYMLIVVPHRLDASCGSASCPLNTFSSLQAGWIRIGLAHEYINQDRIFVGSNLSYVGAIREEHDEVQTLNERNILRLQAGIFDNLSFGVDVPFVHREHSHVLHGSGGDVWESWNFNGLGDIAVTADYEFVLSGLAESAIALTAGVKLPTGVTGARNGEGVPAEVTIQPGSGSIDAMIGVNYRQSLASVPMLGGLYGVLPLTAGASIQIAGRGMNDYRYGNTFLVYAGSSYQFARMASVLLQLNGRFQDFADVGNTGEPRENTGGTWIFLSPGLGLSLTPGLSGNVFVQLPVYQNVHGIQQTALYNLSMSLSYSFSVTGSP